MLHNLCVYLLLGAAVFFPNKESRRRHLFQLINDMNVRISDANSLCTVSLLICVIYVIFLQFNCSRCWILAN